MRIEVDIVITLRYLHVLGVGNCGRRTEVYRWDYEAQHLADWLDGKENPSLSRATNIMLSKYFILTGILSAVSLIIWILLFGSGVIGIQFGISVLFVLVLLAFPLYQARVLQRNRSGRRQRSRTMLRKGKVWLPLTRWWPSYRKQRKVLMFQPLFLHQGWRTSRLGTSSTGRSIWARSRGPAEGFI